MNPLLVSVCREYVELYKALASGTLDHTAMHDADSHKSTLHAQLIALAAGRDKAWAASDGVNYALSVIALADGK